MAEYKTDKQVNYGFGLSFEATGKAPVVAKRIWETLADAQAYVDSVTDTAIAGLQLAVIKDTDPSKNGVYFVQAAAGEDGKTKGVLVKLAAGSDASGTLDAAKQYTDDAKAELLGDAATEYNTLGKLEDEIQAEALRAGTAEKANATAAAAAKDAADAASAKVDTEIGKLNSTVNNEATSAGDAASTQIKVTVEETKGKLTGVTVNAPSFESAGAADAVKTELLGETGVSGNTIISAKEDAAAASAKVDTEIGKLDVTGNTSKAVKGVTVTVDETDGKVIKPVVSIADGTLTGAATDENLVTGKAVKNYVDGEITKVNTAAGTLSGRVDTLEDKVGSKAVEGGAAATGLFKEIADEASTARAAEKKNADAIAAEITRATAAEEKVKTDLIGDAAAEYNTLGKLEDKIQAEALRADTAEKANAAAAAAAQEAANAKVKSVEGTDTVAATTTDHAVSVSLKTSDKGNVKFTQDTDGLSANVTIPEATVTAVKADDKVLALDGTELTSTISLSIDATADDDGKKYIRLKGIDGADLGKIDIADFVKDGMLDSASLVTNPEGQDAGTYIKLTWNTDGGKQPMYINVTSLIDIYTNGDGLTLTDHEFSVDWTKVAKKSDLDTVTGKVSTLEGKVGSAAAGETAATGLYKDIADNKVAIAAERDRATAAEEKVKTDLIGTDADTKDFDTIKGAKKAVEDLKAQIKADAVTLTIPDDDPYITASKDATTNKYTIKSKLDADGTTPLVDVKINTKLTEKINSLDVTGNKSEAVAGIAVTVNETDGIVSKPIVAVTPGSIAADDASVVTGGAVYTAINDALVWHDIA